MKHVLTNVEHGIWHDEFVMTQPGWSVHKRTLRGGLSDGVDVIEVTSGDLSFTILPTRGMGLWRGNHRNTRLGWDAPVRGPVHPKFVNLTDRGGLGWLTGFDEWLCRCGLAWNGPPGDDNGWPLTLHGRIANQPAHLVELSLTDDAIAVRGVVAEGGLFYSQLQLDCRYVTKIGSNVLAIEDTVTNLGDTPAEMQMLYHLNMGPPLLEAGSRMAIPIHEMWPMTSQAAQALDSYQVYAPPTPGFAEQVYCVTPAADAAGRTLAVLHDAAGQIGVAVRWQIDQLPCFTLWKNTAGLADGFVTGLEPATSFPRFKAKERAAGRVLNLPPGGTWTARWEIEYLGDGEGVKSVVNEINAIQQTVRPTVHREPLG